MTFLYPSFLWLFIPLVLLFLGRKSLVMAVHLVVLGLIVIALSRPVIQEGLQERELEAKDIVIALDVSYSMRAKDIKPSRYEFAKKTIEALLQENTKDNIMLIAFTTNPLLLSPPTTDHELISVALKSLNLDYILTKGTSLERVFKKIALMSTGKNSSSKVHKSLLLITDGGEERDVGILSKYLHKANVSLFVLALGTKNGTTVEKPNGTLLKDEKNNLVVSRINPLLESLAKEVDGKYFTASSSPEEMAKILEKSLSNGKQELETITKMQYNYIELYQIFVLVAALLFLMLHTRASKYLLILFTLLNVTLEASVLDLFYLNRAYKSYEAKDFNSSIENLKKIDEVSLQSQVALANSYYKLKSYKKALNIYMSIRSTSLLSKHYLYYNIANTYAMLKEYGKAKIYYTKALQLKEDKSAKENLKLVVLLKKKKDAQLGIAHPKSQNSDASKSKSEQSSREKTKEEDEPSSGSGSGGESEKAQKTNKEKKKRLILDSKQEKQPLSSKVYELINKGYIHEKEPW
jgi:Ca-activated chloride channel family protein